jgi:hypothetical protein
MKLEYKKPRVIYQLQGYKIRQIRDSKTYLNKFGVYAGKYLVNEKDGYESYNKAVEIIDKLISGEVKKNLIKK